MNYEVEQKFLVDSITAIQHQLLAMGAEFGERVQQVDRYFAHPVRNFQETDEAFRIRTVGSDNYITYKGPKIDADTKTRRELELPLPNNVGWAEQFFLLLQELGFQNAGQVCKDRVTGNLHWRGTDVTLALDEVEGLDTFLEIEIVCQEPQLDKARQLVKSLATELKLTNPEVRSYLELLVKH